MLSKNLEHQMRIRINGPKDVTFDGVKYKYAKLWSMEAKEPLTIS